MVRTFGSRFDQNQWVHEEKEIIPNALEFLFDDNELVEERPTIDLPKEYSFLLGEKSSLKDEALQYLKGRGLSEYDIVKYKIGVCESGDYGGRIIIPSFDSFGDVNFFVARNFIPFSYGTTYENSKVEKNKIIFNELLVDWAQPIILTEGPFDAIKGGDNLIPLLGSSFSEKSLLLKRLVQNRVTSVYVALDKDAEEQSDEVIDKLLSINVDVFKIDLCGYKDVALMPKKTFLQQKENAVLVDGTELLRMKIRRAC